MKSENKLIKFERNEEINDQLVFAFENLGIEENKIVNKITISETVLEAFPKVKIEVILQAIENGSQGKYGRTFRFCAQEVCIWIREYQKELPPVYKGSFNK